MEFIYKLYSINKTIQDRGWLFLMLEKCSNLENNPNNKQQLLIMK